MKTWCKWKKSTIFIAIIQKIINMKLMRFEYDFTFKTPFNTANNQTNMQ